MEQDANIQEERESNNDDQFFNNMDYDDRQSGDRSVSSFSLPDMALVAEEDIGYPGPPPTQDGHPTHSASTHVPQSLAEEDNGSGGLDLEGVRKEKKKKLVFLTEKEATVEGRFLENLAAKEKKGEMVTGASVEAASSETKTPREGQTSSRRG